MIRWIVSSSLQFRFLVLVLAAALMVFGVSELSTTPVSIYPEFNPPLVEIQTEALGLSAAEMEALLTVPLEADLLNGVAWLDQIYSESVAGLSSILLVFEPGTDPVQARQMVQERLTQTFALPNVSSPPTMLQPLSTTNRAMIVGLSSQDLSLIEMSVLARWSIKPRLMGVPGVANVAIWGQREWQLQVQVDPEQLHDQGVSLRQVINTSGEALWVSPLSYLEASSPGTAGWIDTPNQRLGIRHLLPITSPEELARVTLIDGDGLLLGDVATVVDDHQPLIGDAALAGGPGLLLVIEKFPGANVLDVAQGVEKALDEMRPGLSGVDIDTTVFRPANYVENSIDNITMALLIGTVLMAIILAALFFEWRTVLICLIVIPVSILSAAFVIHLRGVPFNLMILAGLAIALTTIIDDVVLDVGIITRHLRERRQTGSDRSTANLILEALVEQRGSLVFSRMIILLAVLPAFFLEGLSGRFLNPLGVSYVLAVLVSLVVALIVTPALSLTLFDSGPRELRKSPLVLAFERLYETTLSRSIGTMRLVFIGGVITAIGLVTILLLDTALVPSLKQTDLLIEIEAAPGTSRVEMNRVLALASQELQGIEGVQNAGFHVGRAVTGDKVVGLSSGEIWLSIDPSADYDGTVAAIGNVIGGYPGLSHHVQTYQPERIDEALLGSEQDMVVRVFGHEFDVLQEQAEAVKQNIGGIDGIDEVQVEYITERPQIEIQTDLSKAERYGLKPGDVRRAAATILSGLEVGSLYQDQKVFSVVVWGTPELRDSLSDVNTLMIDTPGGDQIRLGDVADVRIEPSPTVIKRDAVSRFIDINIHVSGRSLAAVASDIDRRLEDMTFPFEYHAEVQGDFGERQAGQLRLISAGIVALLGAILLLQAAFDSWKLAFISVAVLPMALVGGILAIALMGGDITIGSIFGFLAVLGVAVRSNLLLTTRFQQLERTENQMLDRAMALRGAREQCTQVLLSLLTSGLFFLPVILAGNIAGLEVLRPIAIVIWGGLITSAFVTLFIVPTLNLRFWPEPKPVVSDSSLDHVQSSVGLGK